MLSATHRQYFSRLIKVLKWAFAGQLLLIAISPLLSRLYAPAEFGVLAFYINVFGVLAVAASLRLELAIPAASSGKEAAALAVLSFIGGLAFAVVAIPICILIAPRLSADLRPYLWTIPFGIVLLAASNALVAWGVYYRQYKQVGLSRLFQGISSGLVQVLWPLAGATGPLGLVLGALLGQSGGVLGLGGRLGTVLQRNPQIVSVENLKQTLLKYRQYPTVALPASVVARIAVHIPIPMFMALYGAKVAGLLLLSQRIIGLPTILLGRAAAVPIQQELGRAHRKGKSSRGVLITTLVAFGVPGLAMLTVLAIAGPSLFGFVFGKAWVAAGEYARILAPMFFFQLVASPFAQAQSVTGRVAGQLSLEALRLFLVVAAIAVPAKMGMPVNSTLAIYTVVMCFVYSMYIWAAAQSSPKD